MMSTETPPPKSKRGRPTKSARPAASKPVKTRPLSPRKKPDADLDAQRLVKALVRRVDLPGNPLEITAKGVGMIKRLAERGASNGYIAAALQISKDTFRALRERQPEIDIALEQGRAIDEDVVAGTLRSCAMEGQVAPMIFYLKARHGWREGDARDVNVVNRITVNQQVNVEALSREMRDTLRKVAEQMRAAQAQPILDVPADETPEPPGKEEP